jgi:hypothetical protein
VSDYKITGLKLKKRRKIRMKMKVIIEEGEKIIKRNKINY